MLEGLEVREVNSANVFIGDVRLEAKFYTSESFFLPASFVGGQILDTSSYNSVYGLNSDGIGYPVLRMNEFDYLFTGKPKMFGNGFSPEDFALHSLKKDDVLICRTNGNPKLIGKSALVARDRPFVYESHLFKVRPKKELINSAALVVFLNTKYGRIEIEKFSMQGNQANFSLAKFKEIRIPKFCHEFLFLIEEIVYSAFSKIENHQDKYCQAESNLLTAIEIKNFSQKFKSVNVKSFRNSFLKTGRLDAEYYQPKFDNLLTLLRKDGLTIGDVAPARHKRFESSKTGDFDYIEIGGMQGDGTVVSERLPCAEAPSRATQRVRQGDIVTSTVRPIRRLSALIMAAQNDYVCSSGFVVLQPTQITAETLLVYLRLPIICELMDLHTSASLYPAISEKDLLGLPIPQIAVAVQGEISSLVQQSFTLKAESERLLEVAKRAVEIAIERDEAAGMAYLASEGALA